jgi:small-conductance mechanosensitive channel/CRP-like cAMP-binding protein
MAISGALPLIPPSGWIPHNFWHDLSIEIEAQRHEVFLAAALFGLLIIARAALAAVDRRRLRFVLLLFSFYFSSFAVRALLLSFGHEAQYASAALAGRIFFAWSVIGLVGLVVFDLVGRRLGIPRIIRDVSVTVVSLVTLVFILSEAGTNLLSLITTSAILTAVVGLALQDTLGNLLSGIALQLESSVSIGDWIRVDDRAIGKVKEIRWRSVVIQTKNSDVVILPNSLFSKGVITIFNKDELENRRLIHIPVHMRHPPNQVQKVVLAAIAGAPNVSERIPPSCVLYGFRESHLDYVLFYRLVDFEPDDRTDSEVRKRIWYAFHREQIEIPYPAQNVLITEMSAARSKEEDARELARRHEALKKVHLFSPLDPGEQTHLAARMRHELYGDREVILRAGDPGDSLYVIRSGEVAVRIGSNGLEREVANLKEGDFFGEMSLMTGEPRRATVVARGDAECYVLDRALLQEILATNGHLAREISTLLAARDFELRGTEAGLSAERARQPTGEEALLGRIRTFFGLS